MSDQLARGWDQPSPDGWDPRGVRLRSDQPDEPDEKPLPLCAYHATVTERLSTKHSNQIARQAPCCVAEGRHSANSLV